MIPSDDVDELKTKHLCFDCTTDEYLRAEVKKEGMRATCDYCGRTRKCYALDHLADRVERAFTEHYQRTSNEPDIYQSMMLHDKESDYDWDREGEPTADAIMNAAEISEEAARDVQIILDDRHSDFDAAAMGEETEFADDAYYQEKDVSHGAWDAEWRNFEDSIKSEARFFNQHAAEHLKSLFEAVDALTTRDHQSVIVDAGPHTSWTSLFRARVFQSDKELQVALARPERHLGPPPARLATAGRMNARGISVFYGADKEMVALAEVRPPVGSQVAVARFDIIRPLRLLNLTAFDGLITRGSIFDPRYAGALEKAGFLRTFGARLSRPVMPNDEALAYLATQAVADYLATERAINLDGLIFPAVQAAGGGLNVVLFHKAARVAPLNVREGTKIEVSLSSQDDDGWHPDYTVIEETPAPAKPENAAAAETSTVPNFRMLRRAPPANRPDDDGGDDGWLKPTLKIAETEIEIHIVTAVTFATDKHRVTRYRWKGSDNLPL